MNNTNFKSAETHYEFVLGPIKIKDGLFMGDELAAKDIEFIITNKVTHVINTVSSVIPNLWERFGIQYLSVNWTQKEQNIFDKKNNAVNAIFHFVQEAMQQGQSCLIHSLHGKSRSCAVIVAYMMKKYNWTLSRCFQYIKSKKQHLLIRDNYMSQLQQLEKRMIQAINLSSNWDDCKNDEELILKNTFLNSKQIAFVPKISQAKSKNRVTWTQKPQVQSKPVPHGSASIGLPIATNRYKDFKENKSITSKNLKSILKEDPNPDQVEQKNEADDKAVTSYKFPIKDVPHFNSWIDEDVVKVDISNPISTSKKPDRIVDKSHLDRPYSSDNKDRLEKQKRNQKFQPKISLFSYQNTLKSPYDFKFATKINSNTKLTNKRQEIRNPIMTYQRPQSANIAAERRKMKNFGANYLQKRGDLMVMGQKRYPSTNPREEPYKWK